MVLITGWSGAGKTTAGNYLELVHGWKHLDGDNIMHRKDAESLKLTEGLTTSFYSYWFKNLSAPPELWKPYLDALMQQCLEQRATAAGLAVTFSVYRRKAREYLRQLVPDLRILRLDCDPEVVICGALERLETYLRNKNKTVQDWWREAKKDEIYGEYSYESYTKMQMTEYLSGMEPFDPSEPGCSCCDVTQRGTQGLDAIADALRLKRQAVDLQGLKDLERRRLAELAQMHSEAAR
ncbi:unnamed protein product [Cladocopium goreaui]|uniref:Uncharacterized protein n=1 Tax=Cladocopium goreaui TaxID=2562237 RepID=A0A9P1BQU4_9DINO|nr:unnamed protein product [Cladocopium goreaui]